MRRHTKWTFRACVMTCAIATLSAAPAPAEATDPAVEEYTLRYPNAKGKSDPAATNPRSRLSRLTPDVAAKLAGSPDKDALAVLATAAELGAPERGVPASTSGDGDIPSPLAAGFRALDDLGVLLGLLGLIGLVALLWSRLRGRQVGGGA
jgi:hypothetical protein